MMLALGSVVLALTVSVVVSRNASRPWPRWASLTLSVAPALVGWASTAVLIVWSRRLRRRAIEHQGGVCWSCGYVLGGLPQRGVCPECGSSFDRDDLRRRWRV